MKRERPGHFAPEAAVYDDAVRAAVLDAALDCIVTIDAKGFIREFNVAAGQTFGYARSEVIGRRMADILVPPHLRDAHVKGFARHLATGTANILGHRVEIEALRRDGTTFPVELAVVRLETGGAPVFTAYIRDISERVQSDARLIAAQQRYRGLVDSLPVVVYEADFGADGAWRYVSPQIEGLLGFAPDVWLADPNLWFHQIHIEDRDLVLAQEHALRSKAVGERVVSEYRILTKAGDIVWVRDEGVVVPSEGENPVQMRGVIVDITERKDLEARLSRHAFYDDLTGLPNRALFMDRLERVIARRPRHATGMLAVLFLDVDDFKFVNDTLGHAAGDLLLAEIGHRLSSALRPADTPARFGGDEFTVLLDDLSGPEEALSTAARIGEAVAQPIRIADRDVTVTISVGVGVTSDGNVRAHDLISQADIAMYRAKENGKARAELFDSAMSENAWQRLDLQRELRHAIQRGELAVYYQPIVDLTSGQLIQLEALVRWRHPRRGLLLPAEFIPFAESTGSIAQIDRFVLEEACRQLADWRARFRSAEELNVAVNLSPREFRQTDVAEDVARVLEKTRLPGSALTLEITESASLAGIAAVATIVDRISDLGVSVVIDDFGVGYSGLDQVKRFKVDGLKIDRSFVAGVTRRPEDAAIVTAALAFGKALGLSVVAEGIETQAQLSRLRLLGCRHGQGLLISAPLPADELEPLIRSWRSLLPDARRRAHARSVAADTLLVPGRVPEGGGAGIAPAFRAK